MSKDYEGRCHCGTIGYRYTTAIPVAEWSVRSCQCSFCRGHDAQTTSHPDATICFVADELLQRYRFGMKTADFLVCHRCGVYVGAVIETGKGRFGIVNTRALVPRPEEIPSTEPVTYASEDETGRIKRREQRWSRVTEVPW